MPILEIVNESYFGEETLGNVIRYVCKGGLVGGLGVDTEFAIEQMQLVKNLWYKSDPDKRQVRHFVLSFSDGEFVDIDEAMQYGYAVCKYFGERFQIIFGLHLDTNHIHLHFAMNTVSYIDGKMYSDGISDYLKFRAYIQALMPQWKLGFGSYNKPTAESLF